MFSKRICVSARWILLDVQRKQTLFQWLNEWRNITIANRHYQQSLLFSAFERWLFIHEEIKTQRLESNMIRQVLLVWHNDTQHSLRENQRKMNHIATKRLAMFFKIWINEMESQQYLRQIYIDAAKYHISLSPYSVLIHISCPTSHCDIPRCTEISCSMECWRSEITEWSISGGESNGILLRNLGNIF